MNARSTGFTVVLWAGLLAILLAGFGVTAFLWPGFLRTSDAPDEKKNVEAKDDGKKKTEEPKNDGDKKQPEKKPGIFSKEVPEVDEVLRLAREENKKNPKSNELNNPFDQTFVNIAALQTWIAIKTGDKKHLDDARITADSCRTVGSKAHAYYLIATAQARMGKVKEAVITFDEAAAMHPAVPMKAVFEAHFAAATGDRGYFLKAHQTQRSAQADTATKVTLIQARYAVKTKDKTVLTDARKAVEDHAGIYQQKSRAYIAQAEAELGDKDAALKSFADASKTRGVWDVIRVMADTAVATGDDRFLTEAEKLTPMLDTPDVVGIGFKSLAIGHAKRALSTSDARRLEKAFDFARKADSYQTAAVLAIAHAQVEAALKAKGEGETRFADVRKTLADFEELLGSSDQASVHADIAAAEIRLAAVKKDPSLLNKGIESARKLHDTRLQALVAAALAETGHFADHGKLTDRPTPIAYLGLAEGLLRRNGWWSSEDLACRSPGYEWLHN